MADVTVERSAELTKEVALLKSRNKALSNIVDVDKDILIKSKAQATALGELGDNVKSIGNNILSGAENLTSSIFGGALGGVLNSLTIGMVKRKNENAKIEKEKAKEVAKATAEEKAINDKRMSVLVETLALSEEVAEDGRKFSDLKNEEILEIIKNTELEKEKRERNEKIKEEEQKAFDFIKKENKAKENGGATVSSESDTSEEFTVISDYIKAKENGGATVSSEIEKQGDNLEKIVASTEKTSVATTKSEKKEETPEDRREKNRLARDAKGLGGQVVKLEGAEDTSGFSLMDIFKKGGRGKLLGSLATGLTGIGSFAFSKEGGLFSAMKGFQFSKMAGIGLLAGGIMAIAVDGLKGIAKSKEWGTSASSGGIGAALGGVNKGVEGAMGQAAKYGAIGAGLGSIFPGVGTLIGGILGALFGAIMGYFGGERIAKGIDTMKSFLSDSWNSFLGIFGADDKEQTKKKNIKDLEEEIERTKKKEIVTGGREAKFSEKDRATKLEELTKKLSTEEGRDIEQEGKDAKLNSAQQKISQIKGLMEHSKADPNLIRNLKQAESEMMALDPSYKSTSLARGGFIVNKPTYLPNSGVVVGEHGTYSGGGGAAYGGIADGGPEAVIPLSSTRAGAFIDPMARSVAGSVLNQLAMSRVGMDNSGGGGASVVTGNDMSSNQVSNNTTVINNPSPIGQTLPDEGRDFVSKVA
jgi:hypothetical protein